MAMATSATELPDNKYDNSNNLANYRQPEGGYMAYNLDHSVPTYNWAYSVPSDSSQPQLLRRFHKKSSITSHGALSPPTMASPRPYYSNKIKGESNSQGDNASGHKIRKRSPNLKIPEDPFLVGGGIFKKSRITGKLYCKFGSKFHGPLGALVVKSVVGPPVVKKVGKKFCAKGLLLG